MNKYETFRDVVLAVKEKYKDATDLSYNPDPDSYLNCLYSHKTNGIGCAIGCLFPADVAHQWDVDALGGVDNLTGDPHFEPLLGHISITHLAELQLAHDTAINAEHFRTRLDKYLEHGIWYRDDDYNPDPEADE